ncbi:PREDICTED: N-alpha-acetyltransferase 30-like [Rhagoletis zephyria]|uniref:N-alpha-acetyltransferase 30-like n=1 Tax=Rhagoletis zephyria TaxID=28612 RepID=UPI0008119764|nr:PREDICTED: N-alpha-acetyltransferase 30-like [Rhagoletis zephyria]
MEDTGSAIVEEQKLAASQKSKKRQRNKKANGKGSAGSSQSENLPEVAGSVSSEALIAANGITEKLEQQLHIAGDGIQMNGVKEKCISSVDSHAVQNGHHTTASDNTNSTVAAQNTQAAQHKSSPESPECGALKKSKSKKTNRNNLENESDAAYPTSDEPSSAVISRPTEAVNNGAEVAKAQLKNGFHGCINEQSNELRCEESQQQCSSIAIQKQSELTQALIKTDVLTSSAVSRALEQKAAVSASDTCPKQEQLLATIAPLNNATKANTNTAIHNSNSTANQDEENAQQAITIHKTNTEKESVEEPSLTGVDTAPALDLSNVHIEYKEYESELQMHDIMRLIQAELSEPYSIYTYRYFIYNWPKLCFLAAHGNEYVGAIVCKLDMHMNVRRGYIAMLAVRKEYRKLKIGTTLVQKAIEAMLADNADEVVLETEMRNVPALRLYENLGFVRDKRLFRYYLNGVDALRLKLWFR